MMSENSRFVPTQLGKSASQMHTAGNMVLSRHKLAALQLKPSMDAGLQAPRPSARSRNVNINKHLIQSATQQLPVYDSSSTNLMAARNSQSVLGALQQLRDGQNLYATQQTVSLGKGCTNSKAPLTAREGYQSLVQPNLTPVLSSRL